MLEKDESKNLDVSDHCISISTKDSLQVKSKQSTKKKRMSKRATTSLDAFVEDCNNSFSALDLVPDMSDVATVDSRVPNLTGSKTRLTSDRPTRRPVKRTPYAENTSPTKRRPAQRTLKLSEDMKSAFPVKFDRAF